MILACLPQSQPLAQLTFSTLGRAERQSQDRGRRTTAYDRQRDACCAAGGAPSSKPVVEAYLRDSRLQAAADPTPLTSHEPP